MDKKLVKALKQTVKGCIATIYSHKAKKLPELPDIGVELRKLATDRAFTDELAPGSVYWSKSSEEYHLKPITPRSMTDHPAPRYASIKLDLNYTNSPFVLFLAEFEGWQKEAERKRNEVTWMGSSGTGCATTASFTNFGTIVR